MSCKTESLFHKPHYNIQNQPLRPGNEKNAIHLSCYWSCLFCCCFSLPLFSLPKSLSEPGAPLPMCLEFKLVTPQTVRCEILLAQYFFLWIGGDEISPELFWQLVFLGSSCSVCVFSTPEIFTWMQSAQRERFSISGGGGGAALARF